LQQCTGTCEYRASTKHTCQGIEHTNTSFARRFKNKLGFRRGQREYREILVRLRASLSTGPAQHESRCSHFHPVAAPAHAHTYTNARARMHTHTSTMRTQRHTHTSAYLRLKSRGTGTRIRFQHWTTPVALPRPLQSGRCRSVPRRSFTRRASPSGLQFRGEVSTLHQHYM